VIARDWRIVRLGRPWLGFSRITFFIDYTPAQIVYLCPPSNFSSAPALGALGRVGGRHIELDTGRSGIEPRTGVAAVTC
jgi:hypothetical protein